MDAVSVIDVEDSILRSTGTRRKVNDKALVIRRHRYIYRIVDNHRREGCIQLFIRSSRYYIKRSTINSKKNRLSEARKFRPEVAIVDQAPKIQAQKP